MTDRPFGLQLYEQLRTRGHLHVLTSNLDYADIQRLKAADRETLVGLLRGSSDAVVQHTRHDTPEQLAELMTRTFEHEQQQEAEALIFMLFGVMLSS